MKGIWRIDLSLEVPNQVDKRGRRKKLWIQATTDSEIVKLVFGHLLQIARQNLVEARQRTTNRSILTVFELELKHLEDVGETDGDIEKLRDKLKASGIGGYVEDSDGNVENLCSDAFG